MNAFTTEGKTISERSNITPIYDLSVELKDRIRTARQHADMDQSELARRCGVKPSAINHQESGKARSLSGELLMRIAKETRTRPEWLLWEDGDMLSQNVVIEGYSRRINDPSPIDIIDKMPDETLALALAARLVNKDSDELDHIVSTIRVNVSRKKLLSAPRHDPQRKTG